MQEVRDHRIVAGASREVPGHDAARPLLRKHRDTHCAPDQCHTGPSSEAPKPSDERTGSAMTYKPPDPWESSGPDFAIYEDDTATEGIAVRKLNRNNRGARGVKSIEHGMISSSPLLRSAGQHQTTERHNHAYTSRVIDGSVASGDRVAAHVAESGRLHISGGGGETTGNHGEDLG